MTRLEAIQAVIGNLHGDELIVHANGAISRESYHCADRRRNFFMIGSMGLASAIALGLSLARPDDRIVVFDGDGNIIMGLGNLALIGASRPSRFLHLVLDNQAYGTTGNQPTLSRLVPLAEIARACGYRSAATVSTTDELAREFRLLYDQEGPHFLQIKVSTAVPFAPGRIPYTAREIKERFMAGLATPCGKSNH